METCGSITYSTACAGDELTFTAGNTSETDAYIVLDLTAGTEIMNENGETVLIIQDGDTKKCRIKIPFSNT